MGEEYKLVKLTPDFGKIKWKKFYPLRLAPLSDLHFTYVRKHGLGTKMFVHLVQNDDQICERCEISRSHVPLEIRQQRGGVHGQWITDLGVNPGPGVAARTIMPIFRLQTKHHCSQSLFPLIRRMIKGRPKAMTGARMSSVYRRIVINAY